MSLTHLTTEQWLDYIQEADKAHAKLSEHGIDPLKAIKALPDLLFTIQLFTSDDATLYKHAKDFALVINRVYKGARP